jgi:SPP1 gp7 family putative phage head morphogenesis protein
MKVGWDTVKRLHRGLEAVWLAASPSGQWATRYQQRLAAEAKVRRAAKEYYGGLAEQVSSAELARIARALWEKFPDEARAPAKAKAALAKHIEQKLKLDKPARQLMSELASTAELGERSVRRQLGMKTKPPWAELVEKQLGGGYRWTDTELMFHELYPELSGQVTGYLEDSAGTWAEELARIALEAANPARPKTVPEVTSEILHAMPEAGRKWAETVARTETARVYGNTAHETMVRNGIKERRWLTAAGSPAATISRVCDYCIEAAGQGWVKIGNSFEWGGEYPPLHPHCRCDIGANTKGWLPPMESFPV